MLVLTRVRDEKIYIGDNIVVLVIDVRGDNVRLGIDAPVEVPVHRQEIYDEIKAKNGGVNLTETQKQVSKPPLAVVEIDTSDPEAGTKRLNQAMDTITKLSGQNAVRRLAEIVEAVQKEQDFPNNEMNIAINLLQRHNIPLHTELEDIRSFLKDRNVKKAVRAFNGIKDKLKAPPTASVEPTSDDAPASPQPQPRGPAQ